MPLLYYTPSLFDGKLCTLCHLWSPFAGFYPHKKNKDGHDSACKPCARERSRIAMQKWRLLHPEMKREVCRRHYLKYRERYIAQAAQYRSKNWPEILRKANIYHHANKHIANPKRRKRYIENNEWTKLRILRGGQRAIINARACYYRKQKPLEYRAYDQAKRAKRKQAPGHHTASDEKLQYDAQCGQCYWCGDAVNQLFHIDHIQPLARGGTNNPDNICIACPWCNQHKWCLTPTEWLKRLSVSRPSSTANMNTLRLTP